MLDIRSLSPQKRKMNAKALIVFLVFLVWIQISWKWYTSDIKGFYKGVVEFVSPDHGIGCEENIVESQRDSIVRTHEGRVLIFFPYKYISGEFKEDLVSYLDELATQVKRSGSHVRITGHTDEKGSEGYNLKLGLVRAEFIAKELIARGVEEKYMTIRSAGENEPLSINKTDQEKNRRVEIELD